MVNLKNLFLFAVLALGLNLAAVPAATVPANCMLKNLTPSNANNKFPSWLAYDIKYPQSLNNQNPDCKLTTMMLAAFLGKIDGMSKLFSLSIAPNLELKDSEDNTALFYASAGGQAAAVCYLLYKGADAKVINKHGKTAADVASSGAGLTPVEKAVGVDIQKIIAEADKIKGNASAVQTLCPKGLAADLGIAPARQYVSCALEDLTHAKASSQLATDMSAIKLGSESVDAKDSCGRTALMLSAFVGDADDMNTLFDQEAEPDLDATDVEGNTPLFYAVANGQQTSVCYLLFKGADVNIKNKAGKTVEDISDVSGITTMLGKASQIKGATFSNLKALCPNLAAALPTSELPSVRDRMEKQLSTWMTKINANNSLIDSQGKRYIMAGTDQTPMMLAAFLGSTKDMETIITAASDSAKTTLKEVIETAVDKKGNTPLMYAVASLKLDAVTTLIDNGLTKLAEPSGSPKNYAEQTAQDIVSDLESKSCKKSCNSNFPDLTCADICPKTSAQKNALTQMKTAIDKWEQESVSKSASTLDEMLKNILGEDVGSSIGGVFVAGVMARMIYQRIKKRILSELVSKVSDSLIGRLKAMESSGSITPSEATFDITSTFNTLSALAGGGDEGEDGTLKTLGKEALDQALELPFIPEKVRNSIREVISKDWDAFISGMTGFTSEQKDILINIIQKRGSARAAYIKSLVTEDASKVKVLRDLAKKLNKDANTKLNEVIDLATGVKDRVADAPSLAEGVTRLSQDLGDGSFDPKTKTTTEPVTRHGGVSPAKTKKDLLVEALDTAQIDLTDAQVSKLYKWVEKQQSGAKANFDSDGSEYHITYDPDDTESPFKVEPGEEDGATFVGLE